MSPGLSHFSLAQPHWVWGSILSGWLLGGRHWGEPSVQGLQTVTVVSRGFKTVNSGHSGLAPIPYPVLSEVTPEFSLLILDEASEPHL